MRPRPVAGLPVPPGPAHARDTAGPAPWLPPCQAPEGGADVTGLARMTRPTRSLCNRPRRWYAGAGRATGVSGGRWRVRGARGRSGWVTAPGVVPSRAPRARQPVPARSAGGGTGGAGRAPPVTRAAAAQRPGPRRDPAGRRGRRAALPDRAGFPPDALRTRPRSRCSPRCCVMPARHRATKQDAARPGQRHE